MPAWLKILLSVLSGFTASAGAVATTAPNSDTNAVLITGAAGALTALGNVLVKSPKEGM